MALRLIAFMLRRLIALTCCLILCHPAAAMVGGAPADSSAYRSAVQILTIPGDGCTGIVLGQDLVLTAAHCIKQGHIYKIYELDAERKPILYDLAKIEVHPKFSQADFDRNRATADIALLKTVKPLPRKFLPVALSPPRARVVVGERFTIAGHGVTAPGDRDTTTVLRRADLIATGQPSNLQLRLFDPVTKGATPGLGACTGDSGGPVYEERDGKRMVYGVISWTTGPKLGDGCGGLTGVTPLELYLKWIADTAKKLGSPLAP